MTPARGIATGATRGRGARSRRRDASPRTSCISSACCAPPGLPVGPARDARRARGGRRRRAREPRRFPRGARGGAGVAPRAPADLRAGVRSLLAQSEAARKADRVAAADGVRPRRRGGAGAGTAGAHRAGDAAARRHSSSRGAGRRRDRARRGVHDVAARGPAAQGFRDDDGGGARGGARDAAQAPAAAARAADAAHDARRRAAIASIFARRCGARPAPRARCRRSRGASAQRRTPPLVVLCDISGSMDRYARMLLHFLHAITNDRDRVHVLLFGTRLTNITRHLQASRRRCRACRA